MGGATEGEGVATRIAIGIISADGTRDRRLLTERFGLR